LENPRGFRTTSVFDSRGQKTENIDPLGRITTSLFDAAGRQAIRLDARGNTTTFSYDANNRNTGKAYPDGSLVTFLFDAVSNRTAMQDSTGVYGYQYTTRNQLEAASNPAGRIVTYSHDSIGSLTQLVDSAGRVMTFQYDSATRLDNMLEIGGGRTTFSYDSANRRVLKELSNGTRASCTFDADSRLIEHANLKSDNSVLSDFQFEYDSAGNRLTTLEDTGDRVTWTYDAVYQLTDDNRSGAGAYKRSFVYDANGNRLEKDADGDVTISTFDGADQLSTSTDSSGATNYTYDDNGNQSITVAPSGQRTTSTWGYENQVGLVALPSGQLVTAAYNADNRRVMKANDDGVINFNWDPVNDNLLLETDETGLVTAEYSNLPVPFGEPLLQNRVGVLSFFHFDGNHSTRQLTDNSQIVTDVSIFTGYGEEILITGTTVNPFGYKGAVGYYTNSATRDLYVRARTYQPTNGRWLTPDPNETVDGPNLYMANFVPNMVDPSGRDIQIIIVTITDPPNWEIGVTSLAPRHKLNCKNRPIKARGRFDFKLIAEFWPCRGDKGVFIQKVDVECNSDKCGCPKNPLEDKYSYFEAFPFRIRPNKKPVEMMGSATDFAEFIVIGGEGKYSQKGEIKFFCLKPKVEPDADKPVVGPEIDLTGFTHRGFFHPDGTCPTSAGGLHATENKPDFWDKPVTVNGIELMENPSYKFRELTFTWDCCNKPHRLDVTQLPEIK
jgi:RHS repeat-associated protein